MHSTFANSSCRKEPEQYLDEFYREYNFFLKEGVCQDYEFQPTLAKLLRFETNKNTTKKLILGCLGMWAWGPLHS